ncbi:MAG: DUF5690 family protein [Myxococcales bacterium]|nr:DUF5690 family protein [Myxococcales bacterium]
MAASLHHRKLSRALATRSAATLSAVAIAASFSAYFAMYAFRKPFAAGAYSDQHVFGLELKLALVIGQVLGYTLSKFVSIKWVSELARDRRGLALVGIVSAAEVALLGLGTLPPAGMVLAMLLNGLPLGAVWGLVFSYLEGRRTSGLLGAGLSTSYIVASGAVKHVGRSLVQAGVPEPWMPALVGMLFMPIFVAAVVVLEALPAPSTEDMQARSRRTPMSGAVRLGFLRGYLPGLLALTMLYVLLTVYRDFRDNFAVEIWHDLGFGDTPALLSAAELPAALISMAAVALLVMVRSNRAALLAVHAMMLLGVLSIAGATWLHELGAISGIVWMVSVGAGLYLAYVPFNCMLFDRLMAATRSTGTAVFMIFVTDASGYAGSVLLLLYKNFGAPKMQFLAFFTVLSHLTAVGCALGFLFSGAYFFRRTRPAAVPRGSAPPSLV